MSVSALCTLALKASPSPLATLREYSMNHNHVASFPPCQILSCCYHGAFLSGSASSPCLPAKSIRAGSRWRARALYSATRTQRGTFLYNSGLLNGTSGQKGTKSQQRDTKRRSWREWMPQEYSLCARCGAGHFRFTLSKEYSWDTDTRYQGWGSKRPTRMRKWLPWFHSQGRPCLGWAQARVLPLPLSTLILQPK